tara:strand:+ start:11227 stop:11586 length:360 start_codon:yes stop_codon:yes gene_type:complete
MEQSVPIQKPCERGKQKMNNEIKKQLDELTRGKSVDEVSEIADYLINIFNLKLEVQDENMRNQLKAGDTVVCRSSKAGKFTAVVEKVMPKNIKIRSDFDGKLWHVSVSMLTKIENSVSA